MTIHVSYRIWTPEHVRDRIVEAAETLILNPIALGPRMAGAMSEVVRVASESYGYGSTSYRRVPSAGALSRMEETWAWINDWLNEQDRKLMYDYGFIKTRKGLTLARWCEENGWIKRTFDRAVIRCCQRIADELNQKHAIRLTTPFDGVSQIRSGYASFEVASDSRAPVKHKLYHRAAGAIPKHVDDPEQMRESAKAIEKSNRRLRSKRRQG